MSHLRELISMGFSPMMAAMMAVVIVLWGTLMAVVVFLFKRNSRDRERWHAETRKRLEASERAARASDRKHEICDLDRQQMRRQILGIQNQLRVMHACPHDKCPMAEIIAKLGKAPAGE